MMIKIFGPHPIKCTSVCPAKAAINTTKRQPREWEKIFANDGTDRGSTDSSTSETKPHHQKTGRSQQTFLQKRHRGGQEAQEKMLGTRNDEKNANQNHNEVSLPSVRKAVFRKSTNSKRGRGCGAKGTWIAAPSTEKSRKVHLKTEKRVTV